MRNLANEMSIMIDHVLGGINFERRREEGMFASQGLVSRVVGRDGSGGRLRGLGG